MNESGAGKRMVARPRAPYELHDRGRQRGLGRFRTEAEALSYIRRCVPLNRVWHLTLGLENERGEYAIVSDGHDLRLRLERDARLS